MVILSDKEGLPELGYFDIRLITGERPSRPILAVAESIRNAFVEVAKAA